MAAFTTSAQDDLAVIRAAKRILRLKKAARQLIDFAMLTMPSPVDPDDSELSVYAAARHHYALAAALEEVAWGNWKRLIIVMPPRHGKSELASKRFIAWFMGLFAHLSVIFATYGDDLAEDVGRKVRDIIQGDAFRQIFPDVELKPGSASATRLETTKGGLAVFVGRGSTITGRGGDLLILDDPLKGREEADSPTIRAKLWAWFTDDFMTRLMDDTGRVIVIQTRWHEDDVVGRLTNPRNECYSEKLAGQWKILDLPALALEDDPLKRKPGEALWPERFSKESLEEKRILSPRGFSALYQGRPTPDEGTFFKRANIIPYNKLSDLPENLRFYASSDHAVSMAEAANKTCLLPVGVDQWNDIWILPDVIWKKLESDKAVNAMLAIMRARKPLFWWAEKGHISKSIGPFLRQRMRESNTFVAIDEVVPVKDKQTRAQAIQGRMSMNKVHFPSFAPWYADAVNELLEFPNGTSDDFVDALAWIGMGLDRISPMNPQQDVDKLLKEEPKTGSFAWIKWASRMEAEEKAMKELEEF